MYIVYPIIWACVFIVKAIRPPYYDLLAMRLYPYIYVTAADLCATVERFVPDFLREREGLLGLLHRQIATNTTSANAQIATHISPPEPNPYEWSPDAMT